MCNIFSEIFEILDIDKINSKENFDLFISKLINHPTPLREAVAYKLEDVFCENYIDNNNCKIILLSITDINPNVSRCICSVIKKSKKLQNMLEIMIIEKIEEILVRIPEKEKIQNNKNHAKNKLIFSLYWLMEALSYCLSKQYIEKIYKILQITILFSDYTIREKTAKILAKIDNPDIDLINQINKDKNFYVNFYTKLYK